MLSRALTLALFCLCCVPAYSLTLTNTKRVRLYNESDITSVPPCCSDLIGSLSCKRLQERDPLTFARRCAREADFSMIQCCVSCGLEDAPIRYAKFFDMEHDSEHCFDSRSAEFCRKFVQKEDVWVGSIWACSGMNANLAFRICRRSCGFCRRDLFKKVTGYYQPTACGTSPEFIPYARRSSLYYH